VHTLFLTGRYSFCWEHTNHILKGIAILGSGDVIGKSRFISGDFFAKISGSGDMKLEVDVAELETTISGSDFWLPVTGFDWKI
jgi:hypothetical protein